MSPLPFQVLELNVTSAQNLSPVSKNMSTYAIAWVNPDRKLRTRTDQHGQANPTWHEKFVFHVDKKFLESETSFLVIEINALGWLRDTLVGSVRVKIRDLLPQDVGKQNDESSRRLVALQIRRSSGKPRGILHMGVTLSDYYMRSMPLHAASTEGFQEFMDVKLGKQRRPAKDKEVSDAKEDENHMINHLPRARSECAHVRGIKEELDENLLRSYKATNNPAGTVPNRSSVVSVGNDSEIGARKSGSVCNSDVGPSPSMVATAVAWGLYPLPLVKSRNPGGTILADWTMDGSNTDQEQPGKHDKTESLISSQTNDTSKKPNKNRKKFSQRERRRSSTFDESNGMFSCFLNGHGCEFIIR